MIDIATPRNSASASGATGPLCGLVVARVQQQGQARAERERQRDRGGGDGAGQLLPAADQQHVELEPDDEHEQHQPELGEDVQVGQHLRREQPAVQVAGQQPEQARAQCDAGDDLADDGRLTDRPGEPPEQPGNDHDDRDVDEHQPGDVHAAVLSRPVGPAVACGWYGCCDCCQCDAASVLRKRPAPRFSRPGTTPAGSGRTDARHDGSADTICVARPPCEECDPRSPEWCCKIRPHRPFPCWPISGSSG